MSDIEFTETPREQVAEIPAELPVLPLKETVVFPDSMTPLAIGQERSIQLVDDVVSGERLLALVTVRDADNEAPGWGIDLDEKVAAKYPPTGGAVGSERGAQDPEGAPRRP